MLRFNTTKSLLETCDGTSWSTLSVSGICADADSDTYLTVEESTDEDIIRMYCKGNERVRISDDNFFEVMINIQDLVYCY